MEKKKGKIPKVYTLPMSVKQNNDMIWDYLISRYKTDTEKTFY